MGPKGLETDSITIYEKENYAGQELHFTANSIPPSHVLPDYQTEILPVIKWVNFGRYLTFYEYLNCHDMI